MLEGGSEVRVSKENIVKWSESDGLGSMLDRELSERKWSNVKAEDPRDAGEYVYWNNKNTKNCVAIGGKTKREAIPVQNVAVGVF